MEDFQDPKEFEAANEKFLKQMQTFERKKNEQLSVTLETGEMPPGVTGFDPRR